MQKRELGKSGIQVAPWALGGNVFGWTVDEPNAFQILDAFVDAGFNLIDTADVYSRWISGHQGGESETVIGKWIKRSGRREQIVLATKVGMDMGGENKGLSKAYILREVESSLKRLQTDRIDLYQSHKDYPQTPLNETLEAYDQLVRQGKVRCIGASNYESARLSEALKTSDQNRFPRYQSLQPLYNLYDRADFEKTLQPLALENKLGVLPYYSLAAGFLTGKYRSEADLSKSQRGRTVQKYMSDRGFRILQALDETAEDLFSTPARVALAWVMAQEGITAPIASATSLEQFNDLLEGTRLVLDKPTMEKLNQASSY
jgi:aryl-alcohol dehydrogenase-like predicted oxidoreductase